MPRKPRMYLPGIPCHIIQRGNNRDATFYAQPDYQFYLACLDDAVRRYKLAIHAYVLMTNHVHILATPEHKESISLVMQSVGRRYVQYINKEYRRTGTLWEGRHKACLVNADEYLMTCSRYIELNPVAASMAPHPGDYRWSSFRCNASGKNDPLVTRHDLYKHLGSTSEERQESYLHLFDHAVDPEDIKRIKSATEFSMPLGNTRFKEQIELALNRKIGHAHRGRPRAMNKIICE